MSKRPMPQPFYDVHDLRKWMADKFGHDPDATSDAIRSYSGPYSNGELVTLEASFWATSGTPMPLMFEQLHHEFGPVVHVHFWW